MKGICLLVLVGSAFAVISSPVRAQPKGPAITVYKDPTCGCCSKWVEHLSQNGFDTKTIQMPDVSDVKKKNGVPEGARSCHTGLVGGYVIEGHVPAADIKQLLKQRPRGVIGLAVPGMPVGSPGMEVSGGRVQAFDVLAFDKSGKTTVFSTQRP